EPAGPGSNTNSVRIAPLSTWLRKAARSAAPPAPRWTGNPRSAAPVTFGASTARTLNFVPAGCGLSRTRHEMAPPPSGTAAGPPRAGVDREPELGRARHVRRVDGRHPELRAGRLRLLAHAP